MNQKSRFKSLFWPESIFQHDLLGKKCSKTCNISATCLKLCDKQPGYIPLLVPKKILQNLEQFDFFSSNFCLFINFKQSAWAPKCLNPKFVYWLSMQIQSILHLLVPWRRSRQGMCRYIIDMRSWKSK